MMRILSILILLACSLNSTAQFLTWSKTFGGQGYDEGFSATQLADSSYVVVGSTSSFYNSNQNVLFLHVDSAGTFIHSNFINNGGYERGQKIIQRNNKEFWICGFTNSFGFGGFDGYLVKTDSLGNKIEDFSFGGADWDFFNDMIMLSDSSLVIVGETQSMGHGNKDAYILRIDKYGDTLWTKTMGDSKNDWANSVIEKNDTLFIVGGTEDALSDTTFGLFIALNLNGDSLFQKNIGTSDFQYFNDIVDVNLLSSFYLVGTTRSSSHEIMWSNFSDYQGNNLGENSIGSLDGTTHTKASIVYPGTSFLMNAVESNSTSTATFSPSYDILFIKTSPGGWWNYSFLYGSLEDDDANDIIPTSDNGALLIGTNRDIAIGGSNVYLIKMAQQDSFASNELDSIFPITTSLDEYSFEDLNFYPNPTNDHINFSIKDFDQSYHFYQLYTIKGVLIQEDELNIQSVDLTSLKSGMYFLKIEGDKKRYLAKIIKQ
jgi:hypothetical protein